MDFAAALAVLQARSTAPPQSTGATEEAKQQCAECADDADMVPAQVLSGAAAELASLGVEALLHRFFERQEERVAVYRRFEEGFLLFLEVAEATGYEALVASTTASFGAISEQVNALATELSRRGSDHVAALIRTVQTHEKAKLTLTAQLQIVRHGLRIDELHKEGEDLPGASTAERTARLRADEAATLTGKLRELTAELNEALDEVRAEMAEMDDEGQ